MKKTNLIFICTLFLLSLIQGCATTGSSQSHSQDAQVHSDVKNGNIAAVKAYVEGGGNVDVKGKYGQTPLHNAAEAGNIELIDYLLAKGANVSVLDNDNWSVMEWAATKGQLDVIRYLYDKGVPLTHEPAPDQSLLDYMAGSDSVEGIQFLLAHDFSLTGGQAEKGALCQASSMGALHSIRFLISLGANIEEKCGSGGNFNPLHQAAWNNRPEAIKLLLKYGANIEAQSGSLSRTRIHSWTPLHIAAAKAHVEAVKALLESGANPNAAAPWNGWNIRPLYVAHLPIDIYYAPGWQVEDEDVGKVINLLLDYGADVNARQQKNTVYQDIKKAYRGKRDTANIYAAARMRQLSTAPESSGFQVGKFAALAAGAAIGGINKLDTASQLAVVGSMVQDSQAGVDGVNNMRATTQQITARMAQANSMGPGSPGSAAAPQTDAPVEKKFSYSLSCESGVSRSIPIFYKTESCLAAKKNLARAYGCNVADEMDAATSQCENACGDPTCEEL